MLLLLLLLLQLIVAISSIKRSAILMPYGIGYDDTTKYILLMIKVLQDLDEKYHVDLILCHKNVKEGKYMKDIITITISNFYCYCVRSSCLS